MLIVFDYNVHNIYVQKVFVMHKIKAIAMERINLRASAQTKQSYLLNKRLNWTGGRGLPCLINHTKRLYEL